MKGTAHNPGQVNGGASEPRYRVQDEQQMHEDKSCFGCVEFEVIVGYLVEMFSMQLDVIIDT